MTTFYVDNIKHTNHTNKSTGFPKLVVNGSYFLAFPDKGYKGKYEFSDWMYFEGPIVLTIGKTRYRVAASGLGGFSTAPQNLYYSLASTVSGVDYRPTKGKYYPGSQIYSTASYSGGTIYLSGVKSGTYLCLTVGRIYTHWTPGGWYYWNDRWHWQNGFWSHEETASSFRQVD